MYTVISKEKTQLSPGTVVRMPLLLVENLIAFGV
jgi:hypothetical protein